MFESTNNSSAIDESELFRISKSDPADQLPTRVGCCAHSKNAGRQGQVITHHSGDPDFPRRVIVPASFFDPATRYEYELPLPSDVARALELDARFAELDLGLVDVPVAAIAERRRIYRVLTTDRRDFSAIRVGARLSRALELLP